MSEVFYYYLRNESNHPYGCVAICETENGLISRGTSLCSTRDRFDKNKARGEALKRLITANIAKTNAAFGTYNGEKKATKPANSPSMKFEYNIAPTQHEYRIIHKPE